jgi:hypothetical protein
MIEEFMKKIREKYLGQKDVEESFRSGMDTMFINQPDTPQGRSYVSHEDKYDVKRAVFDVIDEMGHDWLLDEDAFVDAIDEIGDEAETKDGFLSGIKDYLNGEKFSKKYYMDGFGDEVFDGLSLTEKKKKKKKKDDRCTRIAKRKYDAWPSAYASGAVVRCRAGKIWKGISEDMTDEELAENQEYERMEEGHMDDKPYRSDKDAKVKVKDIVEDLRKWFGRKGAPGKTGGWVDCNTCRKDPKTGRKKCKACGRKKGGAGGGSRKKYPRCRPTPAACKGYKRRGSNLKKEQKIEEIEYNYIKASDATYDDGTPIDFILEFWDDVIVEAEYRGRKVKLNKPMRGDVKKFKVYVKDPKTKNVKKVNFGDPNMRIKKSNPKRRKSFRARHNCDNPGPKTKARYWSCRKW